MSTNAKRILGMWILAAVLVSLAAILLPPPMAGYWPAVLPPESPPILLQFSAGRIVKYEADGPGPHAHVTVAHYGNYEREGPRRYLLYLRGNVGPVAVVDVHWRSFTWLNKTSYPAYRREI